MSRIPMNATTMDDIKQIGNKPKHNKPKKQVVAVDPANLVESKSTKADNHKSGWF